MYSVDFDESILFRKYGVVCLPQLSVTWSNNTPAVLDTTTNDIVYEPLASQWSNCCRSRNCIQGHIPMYAIFAIFYLFFLPVQSGHIISLS